MKVRSRRSEEAGNVAQLVAGLPSTPYPAPTEAGVLTQGCNPSTQQEKVGCSGVCGHTPLCSEAGLGQLFHQTTIKKGNEGDTRHQDRFLLYTNSL